MPIYELDGERPELPPEGSYYIAETAILIGRVRLKPNSSVWFGAVLRGDTEWIEIGEGSNIQENCTLHTDAGFPIVIGKECAVGHNCIVHGCMMDDNSMIGMGAIVLNGVKIGKNCIVGAGSVVTEGKSFPDNSLIIGSPARAVRHVNEEQKGRIADAGNGYVMRGRQYARGLRRIG